ncbi:MAG TPA: uroporphyrinogen decarboxylase family protein [Ktedonobacterales bacterium]
MTAANSSTNASTTAMTKKERVAAALEGKSVDRVPITFWGHNYLKEWSAEGLASAMLENYRTYGWDWMKVNPRASYFVEDWGAVLQPSGDPNKGPTFVDIPITSAGDWRNLRPLEPAKGVLGEQLAALRLVREGMGSEAYFIQTIFSPLSIAKYLVGNNPAPVRGYMADAPDALAAALEVITETFKTYVQATLEIADGIFFATTGWASAGTLGEEEYKRFGRDYDLRVLEAAQGATFNVLHNCGERIYFDLLADYPVQAISWAATLPENPSLAEGKQRTRHAVMGGVNEKTLPDDSAQQVAEEVRAAIDSTQGRRVLVAPGCSIPPRTPPANLEAALEADRAEGAH